MSYAALAIRSCEQCDAEFEPWTPRSRFCSQACSAAFSRQNMRRGPKPVALCARCGDPFKQMGPKQLHCRKPTCYWQDHIARVLRPWEEMQERKAAQKRFFAVRRHVRRLASGQEVFGSAEWRQVREREHDEALANAVAASDELSALISEQKKDQRYGHAIPKWEQVFSLDARVIGEWGALGSERHVFVAGAEWLRNPAVDDPADIVVNEECEALFRQTTGGMEIEDVARLDEESLAYLQYKLRTEDVSGPSVQRVERQRLREPNRHAGASIPKMGQPKGGKRKRAQQQAVTREHHVRELPSRAKHQHANLRKTRRRESVEG